MTSISSKDREILRKIAARKRGLAECADNARILRQWKALAVRRRDTPTVRLLFGGFSSEVIAGRMRCEGETARDIEGRLLWSLVGRELFNDDTPLSGRFEIPLFTRAYPFSVLPDLTRVPGSVAYHINPVADSIEQNFGLFEGGSFSVDLEGTKAFAAAADDVFGDILPSEIIMPNLSGHITNPLVNLIGMQNYYMCMYDEPEALHRLMDKATAFYENYYDYLTQSKLLLPTNNFSPLQQESFCFTDELPADKASSTLDMWGFLESQETTAVSPGMYGEFVYPYQDRLVKRFGLLSYGCCEPVDILWEDYISKWKNLRKLSVSPFNNERRVGEYLRGTDVIYYSKPRAEVVTNPGPLDEDAVRACFKEIALCASGCLFEVAQREVGTIYSDSERGRRYVELARQTIDKYWKP